jgi:hypothetical protein
MRSLVLAALAGCSGATLDTAIDPPGLDVTVTDFQFRACWGDVSGSERVSTSLVGDGVIAVLHEVEAEDCTQLDASALADENRLLVDYREETDGECSEICWFRVDFMLTGLPAGTWTVEIEDGPSSAVIVP